jgi:ABC-2 type transport system permease protein
VLGSLLQADLTVALKNRRALLLGMAFPVLLLFGSGSTRAVDRFGGAPAEIGLGVAIGLAAMSIMGFALSMAQDRDRGVFQRLRVTPAPSWALLASRLAVQVACTLAIALVSLAVGVVLHHLALGPSQYLEFLAVSVLAGAVFLSIGLALAGLVPSADTVNAAARVLLILLLLLGLLGESGVLGSAGRLVAQWSPLGTVTTLLHASLGWPGWSGTDLFALAASVGYLVVFAAVGIRWFRWDAS